MSNSVTSAFIDLATFDEIEKYLYNGPTAITFFVRCVRKCTWGAQVPVTLTQNAGNPDFDGDTAFQISRAGDYLLAVWLRFTTPEIKLVTELVQGVPTPIGTARWVNNLAHNLIDLTWISFNDLKVQEFDSYWLDIWSAHTVNASKRVGYANMVGQEIQALGQQGGESSIPEYTFNLPLPFFFTRESGIALPTAALPYNEMRIHFEFRKWQDLLILEGGAQLVDQNKMHLKNVQLWANYAVVSNEERVKMGKCPRDMVIEQVQRHNGRPYNPAVTTTNSSQSYDIRMSHSIKALFWVVANVTRCQNVRGEINLGSTAAELSNYTTRSGCCPVSANPEPVNVDLVGDVNGFMQGQDPVRLSSLLYENTYRLFEMGSDYFSLVQPYYHWTSIPEVTGYHSYSFAMHPESLDPSFSTNFGKLTNVSLALTPSEDAVLAAEGKYKDENGVVQIDTCLQTFQLFVRGLNFNIVRVSGGALGLPVL